VIRVRNEVFRAEIMGAVSLAVSLAVSFVLLPGVFARLRYDTDAQNLA